MAQSSNTFHYVSFGMTDPGLVRERNEDMWSSDTDLNIYMLADGMGGHQGGDVAAREAVDGLSSGIRSIDADGQLAHDDAVVMSRELLRVYREVNDRVFAMGCTNTTLSGMGATLCCVYFCGGKAIIGNVGDSRIYRYRGGVLELMTRDDSLLQDMLDLGQLSDEDSDLFMYKNVITKAIGMGPTLDPTFEVVDLEADDIFMLCSDGLSNMVSFEMLEATLKDHSNGASIDVEETVQAMVNGALEAGGVDNVTVVMVQALGGEEA